MSAHGHDHARSATADRRWLAAALAVVLAFMVGRGHRRAAGPLARADHRRRAHAHRRRRAGRGDRRVADRAAPGARARTPTASPGSMRCPASRAGSRCCCWRSGSRSRRSGGWSHPARRDGGVVTVVALVGIAVNLLATALAGRADRSSLNVRGVVAHLVTDIWAFAATCVAGVVVLATGWTRADPIASLVVAAVMAWTGCAAGPRGRAGVPRGGARRRRPARARRGTRRGRRRRRGARPARVGDRADRARRCRRTCSCGRRTTATRWPAGYAPTCSSATASVTSPCRPTMPTRPGTTPSMRATRTARCTRRSRSGLRPGLLAVLLRRRRAGSGRGSCRPPCRSWRRASLILLLANSSALAMPVSICSPWSLMKVLGLAALIYVDVHTIDGTQPERVMQISAAGERLDPCWCRCPRRVRCSCSRRRASTRCTSAACSCSSRRTAPTRTT